MNGNITTAPLGGNRNIKTKPLFQYDYGQVLKIVGVTLPAAYEVHFSNQLHGVATTQIGNADGVIIPDIYLTTGEPVYAWIYLHTGNSDGETEYTITIPVVRRASISDAEPTPVQQDVITQAIAALNTAVEQTAQDVQDATEAKQDAEEAAGEAYESAVTAGQYATTAGGHAADAAEASHNAEYQAGRAEQAHLDAQAAQWAAESAQTAAEAAHAGAVAARTGAETAQAGAVAARDEIRNMHATANTLPAGSQATASYSDGTLTLGIPKGDKGDQGQKGDTGDRGEQGEKGEKGDTGATGATPDFEIGTVQTLPAGSSATATITGTSDNPLLNLGIPKGDKGDTGEVTQAELSALSTGLTSDLDLVQTSGNIIEINDAFPAYAEDVTVEIVPVQSGSGDPSPENVRPITGFDRVKVTRTGKNLLNPDGSYFAVGREYQYGSGAVSVMRNADGSYHIWTNGNSARVDLPIYTASTNTGIVVPTGDYTFTIYGNEDVSSIVHLCGSGAGDGLNGMAYFDVTKTATRTCLNGNAPLSYLFFRIFAGDPFDVTVRIQMEVGTDSTSYESYNGIQVELPFGRTVYGGQIDLTTGKLMVTHFGHIYTSADVVRNNGITDLSDSTISPLTRVSYDCSRNVDMPNAADVATEIQNTGKFSHGIYRGDNSGWTSKSYHAYGAAGATHIFLACEATAAKVSEYLDAQVQAGTPVTVYYPLATPQVYDLTPAQVLLLRDYNVLWANTGDIINLEYRAGSFVPKKTYDALKEATLIHSNASGAIASFADGAEMPVDEVTVQINPVQDLHGYSNPWPGGGGKNLLGFLTDIDTTVQGVRLTFDKDTEQFNVSGTNTNTNSHLLYRWYASENKAQFPDFEVGKTFTLFHDNTAIPNMYMQFTYTNTSGTVSPMGYMNTSAGKTTFTVPDNFGSLREFQLYVSGNATELNGAFHVWLEEGSVASSTFSPYSNICSITGFEGLTVWDTGKNMINPSELVYSAGVNNVWYGIHLPPDTDFVFSTDSRITGLYVAYSDDDEMPSISRTGWTVITYKYNTTSLSFNSGSHKWYRLMTYEINGVIRDRLYQLELGTTATDYEPYQGETYSITFPSEAGTVYGGSLTIAEDGSGVLTVDRAMMDMGSMVWNYNTTYASFTSNSISTRKIGVLNVWSDLFKTMAGSWSGTPVQNALWGNGSNTTLYVQTPPLDNVNDFMALVDGHQLMYELATPITYTLTASQITTLLGENNLWHDANGEITVGYKANTKLYIDGKIAELVAQIVNS